MQRQGNKERHGNHTVRTVRIIHWDCQKVVESTSSLLLFIQISNTTKMRDLKTCSRSMTWMDWLGGWLLEDEEVFMYMDGDNVRIIMGEGLLKLFYVIVKQKISLKANSTWIVHLQHSIDFAVPLCNRRLYEVHYHRKKHLVCIQRLSRPSSPSKRTSSLVWGVRLPSSAYIKTGTCNQFRKEKKGRMYLQKNFLSQNVLWMFC